MKGSQSKQLLHFWAETFPKSSLLPMHWFVWSGGTKPALFQGLDQVRRCSSGAHLMFSRHQWVCSTWIGLTRAQNNPPSGACICPAHLASGSCFTLQSPGSPCLTLMLMHPNQSRGTWKLSLANAAWFVCAHPDLPYSAPIHWTVAFVWKTEAICQGSPSLSLIRFVQASKDWLETPDLFWPSCLYRN